MQYTDWELRDWGVNASWMTAVVAWGFVLWKFLFWGSPTYYVPLFTCILRGLQNYPPLEHQRGLWKGSQEARCCRSCMDHEVSWWIYSHLQKKQENCLRTSRDQAVQAENRNWVWVYTVYAKIHQIETGGCLSNWIPIRLVTSLSTTLK